MKLSNEMLWNSDPAKDAVRKLPDWATFHRLCGENGLAFDIPQRDRNRGPHTVVAFHPKRTDHGGWVAVELCRARDNDLLAALKQAHRESGRATPETTRMLDHGLNGVRVADDEEYDFG